MSAHANSTNETGKGRRGFFKQLLAAVGGGFVGGSILRGLLKSREARPVGESKVTVRTNPLAVPRTKEGSTTHV